MTTLQRIPVAAVVGAAGPSDEPLVLAEQLGRLLIDAGFRLVTGGLGNVMEATSKGARSSPSWREGLIVGVLPGKTGRAANPNVDIVVPTGLGISRSMVLVAMADVVIVVGGGAGTMTEVGLAWQLGKPGVALTPAGGWGAQFAGTQPDARRPDRVHPASSPEAAVQLAQRYQRPL